MLKHKKIELLKRETEILRQTAGKNKLRAENESKRVVRDWPNLANMYDLMNVLGRYDFWDNSIISFDT